MRGYLLDLELVSGETITGRAITSRTARDKSEWLILQSGNWRRVIRLDQIKAFAPQTPRADFPRVVLRGALR